MLKSLVRRLDPLIAVRLGRYEQENVRTLEALVRTGMTVWDIGANIGQMTYVLSRLVGPAGRVLAVEPGPRNARRLTRSVGRRKNVRIRECAVSDSARWAAFAGDGRSDAKITDAGNLLVRTVTLDNLLNTTEHPPSIVKLDIEGHELPAFRGATRLLSEVRPILVVEFHGAGLPERDTDRESTALVESFGYHWRKVPGGWFIARPG